MKKLIFATTVACMLLLSFCKNKSSNSTNTTTTTGSEIKKDAETVRSNTPTFISAQEYNDYIIERQKAVYDYIFKMSDAAKTDAAAADKIIDKAVPDIDKMMNEIKAMPPFKDDIRFRDAALTLFEFYKITFDTSYREIIGINKKGEKKSRADVARLQKISNDVTVIERALDVAMKTAQSAFAVANGNMLQENTELQEKVDNMNKKDN